MQPNKTPKLVGKLLYITKWLLRSLKLHTQIWLGKWGAVEEDLESVIVLISEQNSPRLERMVYYLQKKYEYKFVLIISEQKFRKEFQSRELDIIILKVKSATQIVKILRKYKNIKLIHAAESRSLYPYIALKSKKKETPLIFDFQDLYYNYTQDKKLPFWMLENLWYEKQMIKHSNGFISYSLELQTYKKAKLVNKKAKVLYFPFYIDKDNCYSTNASQNEQINIVYAGGIAALDQELSFNMRYTEEYLRGSNVVLHVYPSPSTSAQVIESYYNYSLQHPNLVMHQMVSNKQMGKELAQYDYGIVPFNKSKKYQATNKFKLSTALKLWNYIESGLPIIISEDVAYQAWLVRHYKTGLVLPASQFTQLPALLNKQDYAGLKKEAVYLQSQFALEKHIEKIHKFYNTIINENTNNRR